MILSIYDAWELTAAAMTAVGHDELESAAVADHLIDCELHGLGFGGLARALSIVERIDATAVPRRPITLVRETPVSATYDGGDQVGYLVADQATNTALAKARQSGIAIVGAYDTWYTGMLSYYLERVAEAGFVGMAAGSGANIVAPHGGTEGRYGTNPIAFGFPTRAAPVIWDIGTSDLMLGEVLLNPRMQELARDSAAGMHSFFVTPQHTAAARETLGPDALLVPEQAVFVEADAGRARAKARKHVQSPLGLTHYVNYIRAMGFTEEDLADGGSDHLVDALVAWGDVETVVARLREHLDAGADQVAVHALGNRSDPAGLEQLRIIAEHLF